MNNQPANRSIIVALITILNWSFLAYLGSEVSNLSPFLIVGTALSTSGILGMAIFRTWKVSLKTLFIGVYGIFGYHLLLFVSYHSAPIIEANLIQYLWPLLIVVLSPVILGGYRLKNHHIIGAILGFSGAVLIVGGWNFGFSSEYLPGYLAALLAAFIWSSYSLLTKSLPPFPTSAVSLFCLISGILSLGLFLFSDDALNTIFSTNSRQWFFMVLIGLGPLGSAFFTWIWAMKNGDPRIIGSLAYMTPLLSTLLLIWLGGKVLTKEALIAMVLIVIGAICGSWDLFKPRKRVNPTEIS